MIRPVYIYGSPILRRVAEDISPDYPEIKQIIQDMFETMHHSDGIGLAAPQIGLSIRLIVIDASPLEEDEPAMKDFQKVFINARIIERFGEKKIYKEGCLSIPKLHEEVEREDHVRIKYLDENFQPHDDIFDGLPARIIQHEYDHLEGTLFTDRVTPLRRRLLGGKLLAISKGKFEVEYKVKLAK